MPATTPVWFLDIAGTLAPLGQAAHCDAHLYAGQSGPLRVGFRQAVVSRIAGTHGSGLVEVRWLTTWEPEALAAWHEAGLGPFAYATPTVEGPYPWPKANTVVAWLAGDTSRRAVLD